jgi:hypothetical protein
MRSIRFVCAPMIIAGALLFVGGSAVRADDDCQKRTVHADHKLHEAIEKHGWQSQQAEHWRAELNTVRAHCWDHSHRWWDEDAREWRSEHWDDHDHDHDRDHDHDHH